MNCHVPKISVFTDWTEKPLSLFQGGKVGRRDPKTQEGLSDFDLDGVQMSECMSSLSDCRKDRAEWIPAIKI
jgi:hypothetical protein